MDEILKLLETAVDWQEHIDRKLIEAAQEHEQDIIFLNTEQQLYQGRTADDKQIRPVYTRYTREIKRAKGQPTDRVTLRDTGDFYDSFEVEYRADEFEIRATDRKTRKLRRKYKNIIGLSDQSLDILIKTRLEPTLLKRFKNDMEVD